MDASAVLSNALVVGSATAILGWLVSGLRRETRSTLGSFRTEMREEIGSLRAEVREEIAGLRTETHDELRAVRSDLTQIALALGVRRRAGNE
ncbi:MAG: hypothetical protein KatS3mg014_2704 [Actinomycetota bacterium]|nr:MAG: hypothetical protein KatS3mg014_2704 [Actinomycetota bacterium]